MDVCDQTLITCGLTIDGREDPFVKVFDIRLGARPLGVLQLQARYVRFLPGNDASAMFVGTVGTVQTYSDLHTGPNARMHQMDQIQSGGGTMVGMAISDVGHAVAMTDSAGHVHLWTDDESWLSSERHNINTSSVPLEEHPMPSIAASDKRMAGPELFEEKHTDIVTQAAFMPEYARMLRDHPELESQMASTMPSVLESKLVAAKTRLEIQPELLARAKTRRDFPGQFIETRADEFPMNHALIFGKKTHPLAYLSVSQIGRGGARLEETHTGATGQPRAVSLSPVPIRSRSRLGMAVTDEDAAIDSLLEQTPLRFSKPKLTLSNIGLADFNFREHNDTPFTGLKASVPNSFGNAVLQMLYFQSELRQVLLGFETEDPGCLATEAGFLFQMMDMAQSAPSKTKICEARNFLRAFRLAPDAQALGLLEPTQLEPDERTGAFVRFILEQFSRSDTSLKSAIGKIFGIHFSLRDRWLQPGLQESKRTSVSLALNIAYPNDLSSSNSQGKSKPRPSFYDLLRNSLSQTRRTKLWNTERSEQLPVEHTRTVTSLPQCLIVNAASQDNRSAYLPLYRQQDVAATEDAFVPTEMVIEINANGRVKVHPTKPESLAEGSQIVEYELTAVVSHIYPSNNLVAHIKVSEEYAKRANEAMRNVPVPTVPLKQASPRRGGSLPMPAIEEVSPNEWLLFNDFVVRKVENAKEVVDFREPWRNPSIFVFRRRVDHSTQQVVPVIDSCLKRQRDIRLDDARIFHAPSIASKAPAKQSFQQLPLSKLPGKGDLVAIDCEMVALSTEESYVNEDGRKVVTRQSQMSLARLSCTLEDETVFIDDYIVTPDPIEDYLTRFSGLMPGDLDPATSRHHLVPLRIAYLKLKRLVERGCVFVGHGIVMKDFPVINMFVPPTQTRDTVEIFHVQHSRFLSLSFLASYLLGINIQGNMHDSIEDARIALRIYQMYKSFDDFPAKLREIYEQGRKRNFQ